MSSTSAAMVGLARTRASSVSKALRICVSRVGQQIFERAIAAHPVGRAEKAHGLIREFLRQVRADRVAGRGRVGQHHIEVQRVQSGVQLGRAAGAEDHLDIGAAEDRLQKGDLEVARQGRQGTNPQRAGRAGGFAQRVEQLFPGGKDRVGMVERDASGLGQVQRAAPAFEKRLAQTVFQLLDLRR